MRTYIPKIAEYYPFLINYLGIFYERENFVQLSENRKCGNLKKNRLIYHNEEKGVTI